MKKNVVMSFFMRILKAEGTPSSIARGVAIGLITGWTLPVGLQTLPTIFLAVIFRANKVIAWSCTCFTNPATVIFLYPIQCYVGSWLCFHPLKYAEFSTKFNGIIHAEKWMEVVRNFLALGKDIIVPFLVGGIFFAVITAPVAYVLTFKFVSWYQEKRQERRLKRMAVEKK